ncbi:hypothetical protein DFH08DRAFT_442761 [Mycena albidolilacea]|uniref:Uncharacterized protein n=1 Tax=Mycena albidolilacea TaxID=1033008 RepID=A0AAD7F0B4_9AGAR|nr:hypothetical protein DFH08DRAFT_442761 [Mycena albidolilacea]
MLFNQFRLRTHPNITVGPRTQTSRRYALSRFQPTEPIMITQNLEPTLCVKRKPVQLCLTMPLLGNDSEGDDDEHRLSLWHTGLFEDHNPTADSRAVSSILTASPPGAALSSTLARSVDWEHLFATLIPVRFSGKIPWKMRTQLFLGSVIAHSVMDLFQSHIFQIRLAFLSNHGNCVLSILFGPISR